MSGAYAVLEGAPCIVTAVDRYVVADDERDASYVADEVVAAMQPPFPWIDATALREQGRKLGLGSSAAIVVASLATRHPEWLTSAAGLNELYTRALHAHRSAQGGGSGVDVAASTFGRTQAYWFRAEQPGIAAPVELPKVNYAVWSCQSAASTRQFLQRVAHLRATRPALHAQVLKALGTAAEDAHDACVQGSAERWLAALDAQATALDDLGHHAGIPIFTPDVRTLRRLAESDGAVVLPAGAGGGDIALFIGHQPPSSALQEARQRLGLQPLRLQLAARGVHVVEPTEQAGC